MIQRKFYCMRFLNLFEMSAFLNKFAVVFSWKVFKEKSDNSQTIYVLVCEAQEWDNPNEK